MKAIAVSHYKQPLEVIDTPVPQPGAGEVLVEVAAAGLNQLDEKIRLGEFRRILPYRAPFVLGHDLAGTVVEVGPRVTSFSVGDVVYSRPRDGAIGTFAERVVVAESDLALAPRSVSVEAAAGLPLVALTAWQALVEMGKVRPGQRVLIHAGAGGVGTIAIQLAKHLGATVATTASASNAEFLRSLGADVVIDYRTRDFEQELSGYDLVLDSLGVKSVMKSLHVVRPGGIVIGISGPPTPAFAKAAGLGKILELATRALSSSVRRAAKKLGVSYEFLLMRANGDQLKSIAALVDDGTIRPIVSKTVDFDEIPAALEAFGSASTRGKVVARIGATRTAAAQRSTSTRRSS
ncbi:NADP-dependent oxidoreductase [Microbacterium sp. HD4P20]|uniref:NADP-dependent oxidoreductase n=1 Tax=Microbacterium sp. HD4P20 TaxID=2864874 RepID=UPI001C63E721|nr:NADP-dependent oxidoreductase [Microbacterium sp. HD4P20]MCP2637190.1 NADP-dependent oxidoreductase [Microbacterium sp. HD4P20]